MAALSNTTVFQPLKDNRAIFKVLFLRKTKKKSVISMHRQFRQRYVSSSVFLHERWQVYIMIV